MDTRRLNDVLKIGGAVCTGVAMLGPVFARTYATWTEFATVALPAVFGAVMAFVSGLGTRAIGTEYQDVADAKAIAKASLMPPPLPLPRIRETAK
jgi:hypothetical protein